MNYLNNFSLAIKNINNYGLKILIKAAWFELFYSIKYLDNSFIKNEINSELTSYSSSKVANEYSAPNIPTPYYFLNLIKNFFLEKKIYSFNLIDLGCGSGRLAKYFDTFFDISFVGIDFDENIIKKNKKKYLKKNFFFFSKDLKKINSKDDLIEISNEVLMKKDIIIYISDSVDAHTILKLLNIFKINFKKFYFVMVNQKDLQLFEKFNIQKKILFKNRKRNISFYEFNNGL